MSDDKELHDKELRDKAFFADELSDKEICKKDDDIFRNVLLGGCEYDKKALNFSEDFMLNFAQNDNNDNYDVDNKSCDEISVLGPCDDIDDICETNEDTIEDERSREHIIDDSVKLHSKLKNNSDYRLFVTLGHMPISAYFKRYKKDIFRFLSAYSSAVRLNIEVDESNLMFICEREKKLINSFSFYNEIYKLCKKSNIGYNLYDVSKTKTIKDLIHVYRSCKNRDTFLPLPFLDSEICLDGSKLSFELNAIMSLFCAGTDIISHGRIIFNSLDLSKISLELTLKEIETRIPFLIYDNSEKETSSNNKSIFFCDMKKNMKDNEEHILDTIKRLKELFLLYQEKYDTLLASYMSEAPIWDSTFEMDVSERLQRVTSCLRLLSEKNIFKDNLGKDYATNYLFDISDKTRDAFLVHVEHNMMCLDSQRDFIEIKESNPHFFGLEHANSSANNFDKIKNEPEVRKVLSQDSIELLERRLRHNEKGLPFAKEVFSIPFGSYNKITYDLKNIREEMDKSIYGLDEVKDNILDQLAVIKRSPNNTPPVLCLSGPPGIGKTVISRIIAQSTGRNFQMVSCAGMSEAFSIMGMTYGWSGSDSGYIVKSLIRSHSMNPLILLDEIDKTSPRSGNGGNPQDALVRALDPEQNYAFEDQYLNIPVDLSQVQFITTVNDLNALTAPLRSRLVVIELSGYNDDEKLTILRDFTIPKIFKEYNIKEGEVSLTERALEQIIERHGNEPGIRGIQSSTRNLLARVVNKLEQGQSHIDIDNLDDFSYIGSKERKSFGFGRE